MSKRTTGKFDRRDRDYYATPPEPIYKLLPHLGEHRTFAEPMCGDGAIIRVLEDRGWSCGFACDLEPQGQALEYAETGDVMDTLPHHYEGCDVIVSNPPWPAKFGRGEPTTAIIAHLAVMKPTWLLLSADFMHNEYAAPLLAYCPKIVSVGRVKWIAGSKHTGFDNAAWYLFDRRIPEHERVEPLAGPVLIGHRAAKKVFHPEIEEVL